jgi:hypothetical protein
VGVAVAWVPSFVRSTGRSSALRFRTIQVCPKDLRAALRQAERAGSKESTMSEQAVEERRGWASDIVWVVLYSIVIFLVMLLWVHVPA